MANNADAPTPARPVRSRLDRVAAIVFIATCLTFMWVMLSGTRARPAGPDVEAATGRRPEVPVPAEPISIEGDVTRGATTAKVVMIEYSDFECPYCARFARDTLPAIESQYIRTGRVLMVFRHLPLPIHPRAQKAAEAAECAGRQGRFWEMHDALFENPRDLVVAALFTRAEALGLDTAGFRNCVDGGATAAKVLADLETARGFRISGTPFYFVGVRQEDGRVLVRQGLPGAQPVGAFEKAIEAVVAGAVQ